MNSNLYVPWDDELESLAAFVRATFGEEVLQTAIERAVTEAGDDECDPVTSDEFLAALRVELRRLNCRH